GVTEQAVREQAEKVRPIRARRHADALRAEAGPAERDQVFAGRQVEGHGAAGTRPRFERDALVVGELDHHVGEPDVFFVADVSDKHGFHFPGERRGVSPTWNTRKKARVGLTLAIARSRRADASTPNHPKNPLPAVASRRIDSVGSKR